MVATRAQIALANKNGQTLEEGPSEVELVATKTESNQNSLIGEDPEAGGVKNEEEKIPPNLKSKTKGEKKTPADLESTTETEVPIVTCIDDRGKLAIYRWRINKRLRNLVQYLVQWEGSASEWIADLEREHFGQLRAKVSDAPEPNCVKPKPPKESGVDENRKSEAELIATITESNQYPLMEEDSKVRGVNDKRENAKVRSLGETTKVHNTRARTENTPVPDDAITGKDPGGEKNDGKSKTKDKVATECITCTDDKGEYEIIDFRVNKRRQNLHQYKIRRKGFADGWIHEIDDEDVVRFHAKNPLLPNPNEVRQTTPNKGSEDNNKESEATLHPLIEKDSKVRGMNNKGGNEEVGSLGDTEIHNTQAPTENAAVLDDDITGKIAGGENNDGKLMDPKTGYAIGKQDNTNIEEKIALEKGPDPLPSHEPQPQVKNEANLLNLRNLQNVVQGPAESSPLSKASPSYAKPAQITTNIPVEWREGIEKPVETQEGEEKEPPPVTSLVIDIAGAKRKRQTTPPVYVFLFPLSCSLCRKIKETKIETERQKWIQDRKSGPCYPLLMQ